MLDDFLPSMGPWDCHNTQLSHQFKKQQAGHWCLPGDSASGAQWQVDCVASGKVHRDICSVHGTWLLPSVFWLYIATHETQEMFQNLGIHRACAIPLICSQSLPACHRSDLCHCKQHWHLQIPLHGTLLLPDTPLIHTISLSDASGTLAPSHFCGVSGSDPLSLASLMSTLDALLPN